MQALVRRSLIRIGGISLFLSLAVLATGCGGSGTVSGKVYYNNQPLPGGTVVFWNADGKGTKKSEIQPDGSYKIEDMPSGQVKIAVVTDYLKPSGGRGSPGQAPGQGKAPKMPMPPPDKLPEGADMGNVYKNARPPGEKYVPIPPDYEDTAKTTLEYTVTKGPQEHDIRFP
jgi:hypothetical protein